MDYLGMFASFIACIWLSWYMTGRFVTFAFERHLVDIPNHRSSHSRITPRGGGVTFVMLFLAATVLLGIVRGLDHGLPVRTLAALLAGAGVAFVGYLDDCHGLSIRIRLLVQLTLAAVTLLLIIGNPIQAFRFPVALIVVGTIAAVVLYAWLINLVNFMDGIDGLVASGTVFISGSCCLLLVLRHGKDEISFLFGILACAVFGFLIWNWPSAHIFMGDAGSYFIGFTLGALMLLAVVRRELGLWVVPILLAVYIVDATATVFTRMLRRECWYKPHRLHGFQHAANAFGHQNVTISVTLINIFWLLPLAVLADTQPRFGFVFLILAWSPIILLSYLFHSGEVLAERGIARWRTLVLITNCTPRSIAHHLDLYDRRIGPAGLPLLRALLIAFLSVVCTCLAIVTHVSTMTFVPSVSVVSLLALFSAIQVAVFLSLGVHRHHWGLMSWVDFPNMIGICLLSTLVSVIAAMTAFPHDLGRIPTSLFVVQTIFLYLHIFLTRLLALGLSRANQPPRRHSPIKRVVIYGANNGGLQLYSTLRRLEPSYRFVGFVDPRKSMKGVEIAGGTVLGLDSDICRIATTYDIDNVVLSSTAACSPAGDLFVQQCRDIGVDVRILSPIDVGVDSAPGGRPLWASHVS